MASNHEFDQVPPEWFSLVEAAAPEVMSRIARAVDANAMAVQVRHSPMLAHWFMCDSLFLANQANRQGMHANALSLIRQSFEALNIVELGICNRPKAEGVLLEWEVDLVKPGEIRKWLEGNVWSDYGKGLWDEPWSQFMRQFAAAIQPYAHYGCHLAQWQVRLMDVAVTPNSPDVGIRALIQIAPRLYDPQKARRITLFHALFTYVQGRIWIGANPKDMHFEYLINEIGEALSRSEYLDGHMTNWSQQFWSMLWDQDGGTVIE